MLVWDIYYKVHVYLHILNVNTFINYKSRSCKNTFKGNNEKKKIFCKLCFTSKYHSFLLMKMLLMKCSLIKG